VEKARDDEFVFNETGPLPGSENQVIAKPIVTPVMHKVWVYGQPDLTPGGYGKAPLEIYVAKIECKCRESQFWQAQNKKCTRCSSPMIIPNYIEGC
jgi:hypothetical protein